MALFRPIEPPNTYPTLERTVMIADEDFHLHHLYSTVLNVHGWQVVGTASSPNDLLQTYLELQEKPQVIITEYIYNHSTSKELVSVLGEITERYPNQQILIVTDKTCLLTERALLPPSLQQIPIILKSSHTVEELVQDLEEFQFL